MARAASIAQAFRLLQAGDAHGALAEARTILEANPGTGRAHLVAGMALRALGKLESARPALERAVALDASDFAAAFELGLLLSAQGDRDAALAKYERAASLRPAFAPAQYAAGIERFRRREWREAAERFQAALAADPRNVDAAIACAQALHLLGRVEEADALFRKTTTGAATNAIAPRAHGQFLGSIGRFAEAVEQFTLSLARAPGDHDTGMFLAQASLLTGRLDDGWKAYAHRETRRQHIAARAEAGYACPVPTSPVPPGSALRIVAEQGLGDILFFLRWSVALKGFGVRLSFSGDPRLHPMLERTGLFEAIDNDGNARAGVEILTGDLPLLAPAGYPPPLALTPDASRVETWRAALTALGPRPWIGVTWRAGTPKALIGHGLSKAVPLEHLMASLAKAGGTVVALQRGIAAGEIEAAGQALGAPLHDCSRINDDLEDALAVLGLLDRHVGVSNTNMHLAAGLGRTAEVIVPFPPEWRWGAAGDASPWYPGFRVLRQGADRDWAPVFAALLS